MFPCEILDNCDCELSRKLNDVATRARRSIAEAEQSSENNSTATTGTAGTGTAGTGVSSGTTTGGTGTGSGPGTGTPGLGTSSTGSPQLPRSQSGISVKSRRSIPSQISACGTSVDESILITAELHDLPEGSESGDSETATEVDVSMGWGCWVVLGGGHLYGTDARW